MEQIRMKRPLRMYLVVSFGITWGIALILAIFGAQLTPYIGQLDMNHPLVWLALFAPSLAGFITYLSFGGIPTLILYLKKLFPRKEHALWYLVIILIYIAYFFYMRFTSIALHFEVPEVKTNLFEVLGIVATKLFTEQGTLGTEFGMIGFLLPYLQTKLKNHYIATLITGLIFGLWILPGYLLGSTNGANLDYLFFVGQLVSFVFFSMVLFNSTKGNLLICIFAFWIVSVGTGVGLYYFTSATELLEMVFFAIVSGVLILLNRLNIVRYEVQKFPDFLEAK